MSPTAALMIQGTGSHVGKSTIVAGLCRAMMRRGISVAPFKPQNMSNNAAVTIDGGEIGRAQALQARAAGIPPSIHMNPVLLKPESETGAQIVVQGRRIGTMSAAQYGSHKEALLPRVLESFSVLSRQSELVLVEGAGSPAEVNLRAGDIANMGFAEAANIPVIIVGDIDRGGVIASLVGTHAVLPPRDRQRIKGFLINKFRGDARLFDSGIEAIQRHTGWQALGVIPWIKAVADLPAEDVLGVIGASSGGRIRIAVLRLARIANFDDLDPLRLEPEIDLVIVEPGRPIPADAALIIIPGSKATIADLSDLREQGWDIDIRAHLRRGGRVLGLCGGYQMLGRTVSDPQGVEGKPQTVPGLGLLDVETVLTADKTTVPVSGRDLETAVGIRGYEIHLGRTVGLDAARPLFDLVGRSDGARSADGLVSGTYVHGVFAGDEFRSAFLASFGVQAKRHYETGLEAALDALAAHLESHVDLDRILEVAGYQSRYAATDAARRSIAQAPT